MRNAILGLIVRLGAFVTPSYGLGENVPVRDFPRQDAISGSHATWGILMVLVAADRELLCCEDAARRIAPDLRGRHH